MDGDEDENANDVRFESPEIVDVDPRRWERRHLRRSPSPISRRNSSDTYPAEAWLKIPTSPMTLKALDRLGHPYKQKVSSLYLQLPTSLTFRSRTGICSYQDLLSQKMISKIFISQVRRYEWLANYYLESHLPIRQSSQNSGLSL